MRSDRHAKAQRPWYKKKRFILPMAFVAFLVVVGVSSGGNEDKTTTTGAISTDTSTSAPAETTAEETTAAAVEDGSGFSRADATFAVNHITVNWNAQAAKAAKDYLQYTHFSRAGLIQQLESNAGSGFTHAQAVYGVHKAGL